MRAKSRVTRWSVKSRLQSPGFRSSSSGGSVLGAATSLFPAFTESDWRKAVAAALDGASLETLVSRTADNIRIEPVYQPREGPRALGRDRPWRVFARLDHPDPGEASAQALDDLASGA